MNAFTWVLVLVLGGAAAIWAWDALRSRRDPARGRTSVSPALLRGARLGAAGGGADGVMLMNQESRRAHERQAGGRAG
ncbi:hypothetical protein ACFOWE_32100 [Planomonospora corallina]|uniref:Uncharacterized protein n=1 Tax=Planomonospora corallina TaxID=1806052 RepID=A0ABV8IJ04_9ACTN